MFGVRIWFHHVEQEHDINHHAQSTKCRKEQFDQIWDILQDSMKVRQGSLLQCHTTCKDLDDTSECFFGEENVILFVCVCVCVCVTSFR
jgi:hypothetical protein